MSCNHSIEPKILAKHLYLSMNFTDSWNRIICSEAYPSHYFICLNCMAHFNTYRDLEKHKNNSRHTLFYDIITISIYCTQCKKHLKSPQILTDVCMMSLPTAPLPLCGTGFPNLGSSCYSSAILAALSACQPIVVAAICSQVPLCRVFAASAIENRNFNHIIHALFPQFIINKQSDAAEFLLYLIDKLCDDPLIRSLFGGAMTTTITCDKCKTKIVSEQSFTVLPVPLNNNGWIHSQSQTKNAINKPRSFGSDNLWNEKYEASTSSSFISFMMHGSTNSYSLEKCMESMFSPSFSTCEKCNNEHCEISVSLTSLPEILILHISRFTKRWYGQGKVFQFVSFPGQEDVDFGHFVPPDINCGPTIYKLVAVVSHSGTMNIGHYVCYSKINNEWILFDDTHISKTTPEEVFQSQAYLLFYVRKKEENIQNLVKQIHERGLFYDFATTIRVISDPQKWIGTVPDLGISDDLLDQASKIAGGNVRREETEDDLRSRFIMRMPLCSVKTYINSVDYENLWTFLFEKGPIPTIHKQKESSDYIVGCTIDLIQEFLERRKQLTTKEPIPSK